MRFITQRSRRVKTLLLAFTLLMQLYLPGAALCLEENGNASIEDYISGFCADSFADSNASAVPVSMNVEQSSEGHCGSCLDIPLAERMTKKEADSGCGTDRAALMHTFSAYVSPISLYPATSYRGPFTESPLKKGTLPGFIKTVILIC